MERFIVTIEETVSQDFVIWAEDSTEALKMAEQRYRSNEICLEPGEVQSRQMAVTGPGCERPDWEVL